MFGMILTILLGKWLRKKELSGRTLFESCFIVVCTLFPDGFDLPKDYRKFLLLYIWIQMCYILSNEYNAIFTSVMISPSKENTMETMAEVVERKYTGIFETRAAAVIANASTRYHLKDRCFVEESKNASACM